MFQCKRYKGSVDPGAVQAFRGAIQGKADKGLFITTGTFTTSARDASHAAGALPIQLVDGVKLIELFESLELGLKPVKTYELDTEFFDGFK